MSELKVKQSQADLYLALTLRLPVVPSLFSAVCPLAFQQRADRLVLCYGLSRA